MTSAPLSQSSFHHKSPVSLITLLLYFIISATSSQFQNPSQAINNQTSKQQQINFGQLNYYLQTIDIPNYLNRFQNVFTYKTIKQLNKNQIGNYLFLLGKMYIYNIFPQNIKIDHIYNISNDKQLNYQSQSNYLLGYAYLKQSAQQYQNQNAYYYLSLLEFMKLTPSNIINSNINKIIYNVKSQLKNNITCYSNNSFDILKQWQKFYPNKIQLVEVLQTLSNDMKTHYLHNTEHNLYMASLYGHNQAKLTMAYMMKNGVGTQKNCSSSAAYYLSSIRNTKIDKFLFHLQYSDKTNFQKELYSHRKADLRHYGQHDLSLWMPTTKYDQQTLQQHETQAMNYFTGSQGFIINETKSAQMFQKMKDISLISRINLGFLYLSGRGVNKNFDKARTLFQKQSYFSKIAQQMILIMKYYNLGYSNQRNFAIKIMSQYFRKYIHAKNASQSKQLNNKTSQTKPSSDKPQLKQQPKQKYNQYNKNKNEVFKTSLLKYVVGSLVLSEYIPGKKDEAVSLIREAAEQRNPLAIVQMGLILLDGSDSFFHCVHAVQYFSKQALSQKQFQQLVQLAKLAIKKQKYMFAFVKYIQLMMVGYKNAFVNAYYLIEVYGKEMFNFGKNSWSVAQAKKNNVYEMLVQFGFVNRIDSFLLYSGEIVSKQSMFSFKNMQQLTTVESFQQQIQQTSQKQPIEQIPQLKQYIDFIRFKITELGIRQHQISILQYYKYKQTKNISILQRLAQTVGNSPHLLQSRYLLGRYYHHNITFRSEKQKYNKVMLEYTSATKNKFLAEIIYFLQSGESTGLDRIVSHLLWYVIFVIVGGMYFYWVKNKKLDQIFKMAQNRRQENMDFIDKENEQNNSQQNMYKNQQHGLKQDKQQNANIEKKEQQYKGIKFSEQEEQIMKRQRYLTNISEMISQQKKCLENRQKVDDGGERKQRRKNKEGEDVNLLAENKDNQYQQTKEHYQ